MLLAGPWLTLPMATSRCVTLWQQAARVSYELWGTLDVKHQARMRSNRISCDPPRQQTQPRGLVVQPGTRPLVCTPPFPPSGACMWLQVQDVEADGPEDPQCQHVDPV